MTLLVVHDKPEPINPCNPSPCGINAVCQEQNRAGSCSCLPDYFGDPYTECRPECVMNSDCPKTKACRNLKCQDPCIGVCGLNSECHVTNHSPYCTCFAGYTGSPSTACHEIQRRTTIKYISTYPLYYTFSSKYRTTCTYKSMRPLALWPVQPVPRRQRSCGVLMLSKLHRNSTNLPTRVYIELRLFIGQDMFEWEMHRSLSWNMWLEHQVSGH